MSAFGRLPPLLAGFLTLCCFGVAYAALTNQTPYCYTYRVLSDGRVEYKEFSTSAEANEYTNQQGFWERQNGVSHEESGCSSDKVYLWEGALAGAFALLGLALPVMGVKPSGMTGVTAVIAKTMLGLLTIGSFFSLMSIGAIVAPLLIPFHWLAARSSSTWTRGVWIFFAGVCSWILGQWAVYTFLSEDSLIALLFPFAVSGAISIIFVASTSPEFQEWAHE